MKWELIPEESLVNPEGKEEEESSELITGINKGEKINRLLKKNSKEQEEIMKAELELKKKFVKSYGKIESVKKSLKFSLQNWKYQMYNQLNIFIHQLFSMFVPAFHAKIVTSITSFKNYD